MFVKYKCKVLNTLLTDEMLRSIILNTPEYEVLALDPTEYPYGVKVERSPHYEVIARSDKEYTSEVYIEKRFVDSLKLQYEVYSFNYSYACMHSYVNYVT